MAVVLVLMLTLASYRHPPIIDLSRGETKTFIIYRRLTHEKISQNCTQNSTKQTVLHFVNVILVAYIKK